MSPDAADWWRIRARSPFAGPGYRPNVTCTLLAPFTGTFTSASAAIEKVIGGNFHRVLRDIWTVRT